MATLSATELSRLRHLSGGIVGASEKDYLTDEELQAEYTQVQADYTDDLFNRTVVYVLRLRVGMTAAFVDRNHDLNSEQLSQRHQQLKTLLEYWEGKTGMGGGKVTSGFMTLGIDTDYD